MLRGLFGRLRRLRDAKRGIAAVEFALIAPVLLIFYFGSVEVSLMLQADRKVSGTAASMADLVTRMPSIDADELDNVYRSAELTLMPMGTSGVRLRITSVEIDPDSGDTVVDWSRANANWTDRATGSNIAVPSGMIPPNGSVILAEIEYDYASPTGFLINASSTLAEEHWMRPRRTDFVTLD